MIELSAMRGHARIIRAASIAAAGGFRFNVIERKPITPQVRAILNRAMPEIAPGAIPYIGINPPGYLETGSIASGMAFDWSGPDLNEANPAPSSADLAVSIHNARERQAGRQLANSNIGEMIFETRVFLDMNPRGPEIERLLHEHSPYMFAYALLFGVAQTIADMGDSAALVPNVRPEHINEAVSFMPWKIS